MIELFIITGIKIVMHTYFFLIYLFIFNLFMYFITFNLNFFVFKYDKI